MPVGFVGVRNGGPCGSVSKRQAWLSAGERPGERTEAAPQAILLSQWVADGQAILPIGGVGVGCGVGWAAVFS